MTGISRILFDDCSLTPLLVGELLGVMRCYDILRVYSCVNAAIISVFGLTFSLVLFFQASLKPHLSTIFGKGAPIVEIILSAIGCSFIYKLAIYCINTSSFFKKIYWGTGYLDGLWSYTSHCNGKN